MDRFLDMRINKAVLATRFVAFGKQETQLVGQECYSTMDALSAYTAEEAIAALLPQASVTLHDKFGSLQFVLPVRSRHGACWQSAAVFEVIAGFRHHLLLVKESNSGGLGRPGIGEFNARTIACSMKRAKCEH